MFQFLIGQLKTCTIEQFFIRGRYSVSIPYRSAKNLHELSLKNVFGGVSIPYRSAKNVFQV